uniref:Signal peptidase complex subunit 2 n=1 Tax=Helicotheca tamesis TaxID=374047 RepID=A0A7S2GRX6_9STRA|eukprot:CAMPEP_0185723398 /NCGR_PEP_ID=MMETSP1171-20130828/255_1 /TAXON_ID=374046 /ORGANISM="Helicotheca tamensis, Strain CCMP826" /LENGTH=253 /DNA_ID=CAMNT_0028391097 /DNA_START=37 /DNA_END=798 /DNA_ORIENTATION=+
MARKKKNTEPKEEEVVEEEEEEIEEDDDEEEMELLQVEVGDIVKLKQVLDETVAGALLDNVHLPEDHALDNIKLGIMTLACAFAVVAQFSPVPFPECRPLLGLCCCAYFLLSGVMQCITTFLDKDCIMTTKPLEEAPAASKKDKKSKSDGDEEGNVGPPPAPKTNMDMAKYGLRIRTNLPRFSEFFTLIIEFQGVPDTPFVTQTWSVGQFFDAEGMFDEIGMMEEVEAVYERFAGGKFDKEETEADRLAKKQQ